MLFRILVTASTLAVFSAVSVQGKTLEEALKEKGILTEQELKEITPSVSYRPGEGFTLTSPDDRFQLTTGALVQIRYTYTDTREDERRLEDQHRFEARRLYWWLKGYAFSRKLAYRLQTDLSSNARLFDAWLAYTFRPELRVILGQMVVPFGRQAMTGGGTQQFVDRSEATATFMPFYDIGLAVDGDLAGGLVRYSAGIYNGSGQNTARTTDGYALNGRLEINPLGKMPYSESDPDNLEKPLLGVGTSLYYNRLRKMVDAAGKPALESRALPYASATGWLGRFFNYADFAPLEELDIVEWEADVALKWRGFFAQAEYFYGRAEGARSGEDLKADGLYAQAGYFIIPEKLEAAYRFSYIDPFIEVTDNTRTDHTAALGWYFAKHLLKVQADVTFTHTQNWPAIDASSDDIQYRIQAQMIF